MSQLNRRNALALVASLPALAVPGGRNIGTRSEAAIEAHKAAYAAHGEACKAFGGVAGMVGIESGVVSGVFNLEPSGVEAPDWRPRHETAVHLFDSWIDPLETEIRGRVRGFIEELIREELEVD